MFPFPLKPVVRGGSLDQPTFEPSDSAHGKMVEAGHVRLDVEKRSAIQHVNVTYTQPMAVDSEQAHRRDAEFIGSSRRPGRKDAMVRAIEIWLNDQRRLGRTVKLIYQPQPFKTLDVSQAQFIFGEHFDRALCTPCDRALDGGSRSLFERRSDNPNGLKRDFWSGFYHKVDSRVDRRALVPLFGHLSRLSYAIYYRWTMIQITLQPPNRLGFLFGRYL